jgi:hypothetical protein
VKEGEDLPALEAWIQDDLSDDGPEGSGSFESGVGICQDLGKAFDLAGDRHQRF